MRALIIGGGKVGSYLARRLSKEGHVVALIETNRERARRVVADAKVLVFEGDGTDVELLGAADVDRADWLLAVTGVDEDNLVAAQLGLTLGAKRVLARLNDPINKATFDALGIKAVAVTDLMADVISRELAVPDVARSDLFAGGKVEIFELDVPKDFDRTTISDLGLPVDSVIVTVGHGDSVVVARGATVISGGDRLVVASKVGITSAVYAVFGLER
jgi:trk system potassium uptake protein TrkA